MRLAFVGKNQDAFKEALRTFPVPTFAQYENMPGAISGRMHFAAHNIVRGAYANEAEYLMACQLRNVVPDLSIGWEYNEIEQMFLPVTDQDFNLREQFFRWRYHDWRSEVQQQSKASQESKRASALQVLQGGRPQIVTLRIKDSTSNQQHVAQFKAHTLEDVLTCGYEPRYGGLQFCDVGGNYAIESFEFDLKGKVPNLRLEGNNIRAPVAAWFNGLRERYEVAA
jgi:hypothetical protein